MKNRAMGSWCELAQRSMISDGGHEARRLEQERDAAVRCSAWFEG